MSYSTTGFTKRQISTIVDILESEYPKYLECCPVTCLTPKEMVMITLTYLRRNRVQTELADEYQVSQPTISRVIDHYTWTLEVAFREAIPPVEELKKYGTLIVDGTLLPCWSWRKHQDLYSGKHKTTGMSAQVVCTAAGRMVHVSDPVEGKMHDKKAFSESKLADHLEVGFCIGDRGYQGTELITPVKTQRRRAYR